MIRRECKGALWAATCVLVVLILACSAPEGEESPATGGEGSGSPAATAATQEPADEQEAAAEQPEAGQPATAEQPTTEQPAAEQPTAEQPAAEQAVSDAIPGVVYACAACHALPPPDILPRQRWPHMITRMKLLIEQYQLGAPIKPFELEQILRYYVANSPEYLEDTIPEYAPPTLGFAPGLFGAAPPDPGPGTVAPIIGNLNVTDLNQDGQPDVLVSDIAANALTWISPNREGKWAEAKMIDVTAPARTEVADFDADGNLDIVVAGLGQMDPTDDRVGFVVLELGNGRGAFTPRMLIENVARVSDVRPADVDGDGDLDILYAAYGLYKTGHIGWLERGDDGEYTPHTIHTRNGISHIPVADLNGDGRPDMVALLSQQHEEISAFINQGQGHFDQRVLYKGPHPMFGSAAINLVDLDRDGDIDVAFANGDALDSEPYAKPWHGVHWLENRGAMEFVHHEIVRFHGAYSVVCGDLDGDKDLDIVTTSMMNRWDDPLRQSIIWLENDGSQKFIPHALSPSPTYLVAAALIDLDNDERLDVIAGGMYVYEPYFRVGRITQWLNLGAP